jgi:hypothetical protein
MQGNIARRKKALACCVPEDRPVNLRQVHVRVRKSYTLKHPQRLGLRVTVPFQNKDLKQRTLLSMIKQASLTVEEFAKLL